MGLRATGICERVCSHAISWWQHRPVFYLGARKTDVPMPKSKFHHDQSVALVNATKTYPWPDEIDLPVSSDRALTIFTKSLQNRAYGDWASGDIIAVAQYAKLTAASETIFAEIEREGWTVLGGRNGDTPVTNPKVAVYNNLLNASGSIAKRINLASGYQAAKSKDRGPLDARAKKDRETREAMLEVQSVGKSSRAKPTLLA